MSQCPTGHTASSTEVEETRAETDHKKSKINNNPTSVGHTKRKQG